MRHILQMNDNESKIVHISVGDDPHPVKFRFYPNGISGHLACHSIVFDLISDMENFFITRDPRDIIVSWAHYAKKLGDHHILARLYKMDTNLKGAAVAADIKGADDRIRVLIESMRPYMTHFLDWPQYAHTVTYEGLINDPEKELAEVAEILEEPLDELVERSRFRGGKTFRKGVPGEWRHEFTDEHNELFWENFSDVMEKWGYE